MHPQTQNMSVKLRLRRKGRTHSPYYHIVAADARSPRDGRVIEQVGTYAPLTQPEQVTINHKLAMKWLKNGAEPTETVRAILSKEGLMLKLHLHRKGKSEEEIEQSYQTWLSQKEEKTKQQLTAKEIVTNDAKRKAIDQEKAKNQLRLDKIAAKLQAAIPVATPPEATPTAETTPEATPEPAPAE